MKVFFLIVLEVYQFARDAAVAEAWLIAQEPYLMSQELGVSTFSFIYHSIFCLVFAVVLSNPIFITLAYH